MCLYIPTPPGPFGKRKEFSIGYERTGDSDRRTGDDGDHYSLSHCIFALSSPRDRPLHLLARRIVD